MHLPPTARNKNEAIARNSICAEINSLEMKTMNFFLSFSVVYRAFMILGHKLSFLCFSPVRVFRLSIFVSLICINSLMCF